MHKFIIFTFVLFYYRCIAFAAGDDVTPILTGKAVAFSYQVAIQEKIINNTGESIVINKGLSAKKISSQADQLLKKALSNPSPENVRQYLLFQRAINDSQKTAHLIKKPFPFIVFFTRQLKLALQPFSSTKKPIATRASFINQRFRLGRSYNTWFFHSVWV